MQHYYTFTILFFPRKNIYALLCLIKYYENNQNNFSKNVKYIKYIYIFFVSISFENFFLVDFHY